MADEVRERDRRDVARLSVDERIALALRLGELDLELYCSGNGLDRGSGLRRLRQQRQQGRALSACMSLEES
ncbi:MAG TPA: hypothetical protein VKY89_01365 [Thermoanaerobaculia bacterium]|nr:hypothetical protein [Thermoanaerobaculia bacterium]